MVHAGRSSTEYKQGNGQKNKVLNIVVALDKGMATSVLDILTHPPSTKKHAILKDRPLDAFKYSEREAAAEILEEELVNSKPLELLDRVLALVPSSESPSFLFKEVFHCKLPPQIKDLITQTEIRDLW